jgi:mono/diheme cytochrome c family protein
VRRLGLIAVLVLVTAGCATARPGGKDVTPTPTAIVGKAPAPVTAPKGDPAAGKALFASNGCGACHTFKPAASTGTVGPDLDKLAAYAKAANMGSLEEFTRQSITDPGAYVEKGYANGVMPAFTTLTPKQLSDLVAFLTQSH